MLVLTKNKYKNSKHYLLVYYGLKEAVFDCRRIRPSTTDCYYNRIQSFDNLIEIENYIKSISFIELTYKLKIFCIEQLRIEKNEGRGFGEVDCGHEKHQAYHGLLWCPGQGDVGEYIVKATPHAKRPDQARIGV